MHAMPGVGIARSVKTYIGAKSTQSSAAAAAPEEGCGAEVNREAVSGAASGRGRGGWPNFAKKRKSVSRRPSSSDSLIWRTGSKRGGGGGGGVSTRSMSSVEPSRREQGREGDLRGTANGGTLTYTRREGQLAPPPTTRGKGARRGGTRSVSRVHWTPPMKSPVSLRFGRGPARRGPCRDHRGVQGRARVRRRRPRAGLRAAG